MQRSEGICHSNGSMAGFKYVKWGYKSSLGTVLPPHIVSCRSPRPGGHCSFRVYEVHGGAPVLRPSAQVIWRLWGLEMLFNRRSISCSIPYHQTNPMVPISHCVHSSKFVCTRSKNHSKCWDMIPKGSQGSPISLKRSEPSFMVLQICE